MRYQPSMNCDRAELFPICYREKEYLSKVVVVKVLLNFALTPRTFGEVTFLTVKYL